MTTHLFETIRKRLSRPEIKTAILFGSQAQGTADEDSDIDLLVVLARQGIAATYAEALKQRSQISRLLMDVRRQHGLDVLVYTIDEWAYIKEHPSYLSREIEKTGVRLV